MGWKYKTGAFIRLNDRVLVSKSWCKKNGYTNQEAVVVGLYGFITVRMNDGVTVDFYPKSITLLSYGDK